MTKPKVKRGFAAMTPEKRKEIASMGGRAVPGYLRTYAKNKKLARKSARKGGKASPGNFANNPERAAEAGRIGGKVNADLWREAERRVALQAELQAKDEA